MSIGKNKKSYFPMKEKTILDKNISFINYATFRRAEVLEDGRVLKFIMACGDSYQVPLEYIINWFKHPHYLEVDNELMPWDESHPKLCKEAEKILRCEKVLDDGAIRIFFNNNIVYDVAWDTVLMSCDELYEHFGGLTDESKLIVNNWFRSRANEIVIMRNNSNPRSFKR